MLVCVLGLALQESKCDIYATGKWDTVCKYKSDTSTSTEISESRQV